MHNLLRAGAITLAMAFGAPTGPALADGELATLLSAQDNLVLEQFETRREAAIARARTTADISARARLEEALSGKALEFDFGYDPSGNWRCRYLKLGGELGLTVYGWFTCRIFDDGAGWVLEKTTGSQLTRGRLYRLSAERLLYLGALHYAYEAPKRFRENPARDQMAVLVRLADGRLRLEFPAPLAESDFDILELVP